MGEQIPVITAAPSMQRTQSPLPACPSQASHGPVRAGASTYADVLGNAGGRELESLMRRDDRNAVGVALYSSPPYDLQVPALAVSRLSITLTAARVTGKVEGERARVYESSRYAFFLTPGGAAAQWRKEAPSRHINIYFHPEAGWQGLGSAPVINLAIPGVRTLVDELVSELASPVDWSAEAADSLARLLLVRAIRLQARRPMGRNPLSPLLLARLHDFVQAHLSGRILVGDMAAVVGLTPNRFAHAYAALTGQSPHQYVMAQRLQHAVALLGGSAMSLAEVAAASGFASQQHMTQLMRTRLGTTPGRYRQGSGSTRDG